MPGRRRRHYRAGFVAALACTLSGWSGAAVARADLVPCGLLSACPSPPVSAPPATSPPVTPQPGKLTATFDGHVGSGRGVEIQVQNGAVTRTDIAFFHGRCTDGGQYVSEVGVKLPHPVTISAGGGAAFTAYSGKAFTYNRTGKRVNGREAMKVQLTKVSAGSAAVRFHDTFRSGRFRCDSGSQAATAYPQGSAKAPLKDGAASSGSYRGSVVLHAGRKTKREGLRVSVYLPWGVMTDARFSWVLDCNGHTSFATSELGPLLIKRSGGVDGFGTHGHGNVRYTHGIHGDYTYSLSGQFGSGTTASLVWSYQESDYRGSAFVGTCNGNAALTAKHG